MDPLKLALATAGAGGAGLGAYGMYSYGAFSGSKAENIGTRLIEERFELLKDSHTEQWKNSLSKYNSKTSSSVDENRLKDICKELISKNKTSESDYKTAKLYCVVPRSVQERLKDLGLHVLKTTGDNEDGDKSKWTKLAESYVTKGTGDNQIESLTLTAENTGSNNWSSLRQNCKTVLEKEHWDDKFDTYFLKSKMWCTDEAFKELQ
ncbi:hypothetical protein HF1_10040 [Mycoplasma haemofelis str. Langford 1]|uniref:Uncharacterized protein n=1 Tax=Mycoplasma haemofelis (strain Langford 1) TaxID=941640 RepID=E8ZIP1_MYCHL|nr:hypothetical protein [Mycoplasma haemofelis]CBY93012.1 hypothetical protein HF1_10040 [Mycoplasma haemofelis str. Langford 1]